jgi:Ser/Thr protein kinase RdoA (MazF antagonist)
LVDLKIYNHFYTFAPKNHNSMIETNYQTLSISEEQASEICHNIYGIKGIAKKQAGELDFNYKITTESGENYILKISRPNTNEAYLDFQQKLLLHIYSLNPNFKFPKIIQTKSGGNDSVIVDDYGQIRKIRLLDWVLGRLWSSVNPQLDDLRYSLGEKGGEITQALSNFQQHNGRMSIYIYSMKSKKPV